MEAMGGSGDCRTLNAFYHVRGSVCIGLEKWIPGLRWFVKIEGKPGVSDFGWGSRRFPGIVSVLV